jgi:tetratricopeptide (TPR) repeat protein/tRNA A-37 threonylcarbamoyl transferase component Bud32
MSQTPGCVEAGELQSYLLGDLHDSRAAAVAVHLEGCSSCEEHAARLDGLIDPVLRCLRRAFLGDALGGGRDTVSWSPPFPLQPRLFRVAGYQVLAELGRGGTGVVYKARQARPDRLVALKVILAGAHAGPDRRARFLAEADAIARLQHPGIVAVHEVGFADDVPFFSMELVEGGSLHDKLAGAPQRPGPAAALVEALARAVHYAHERGVIHRDLKPGNVLLTPDGAPKVADFGLARLERPDPAPGGDPPAPTASGAVLGTPSYMAPEQASGNSRAAGPACDVYALGAILYEMLTGRPPFRAATVLDTLEQVRTRDVIFPSRLQPGLPRDLETICLKCLAREPARRYGSAAGLAEDLARFGQGRPVQARRTPAWERVWKGARRRPLVSASLALAGLALASLLGVWALFTVRLRDERNRANAYAEERDEQRVAAEEQRSRAEANEDRAFEAVDRFLTGVADKKLASIPGLEEVRRQLLTDALEVLQTFLKKKGGDTARARRQVAAAHRRCARIHGALGNWPQQHDHLLRALRIHRLLVEEFPDDDACRFDLSQTLHNLGVSHGGGSGRDRLARADAATQEALAIRTRLVKEHPDNDAYHVAWAGATRLLAGIRRRQGRLEEAATTYRAALASQERLIQRHPASAGYRSAHAITCGNLAILQYGRGKYQEAESFWVQARDAYERLLQDQPADAAAQQGLALTVNYLGVVYLATGRADLAARAGQRSLELHRALARRYRSIPAYRGDVASAHNNLARAFEQLGKPDEAERHHEAACAGYRELAREHPSPGGQFFLAKACVNLSVALQMHHKHKEAGAPCREAVTILTPLAAEYPKDPDLAVELGRAHTTLANQLLATTDSLDAVLGSNEKAVRSLEGALRLARGRREALEFLGRAQVQRATLLALRGRQAEALTSWDRARQLGHPFPPRLHLLRAFTLAGLGKWDEAVRVAEAVTAAVPEPKGEMLCVACLYARCAEAVTADAGLDGAQRLGRAADWEGRAVALLTRVAAVTGTLPGPDIGKWCPEFAHEADARLLRAAAGPRFAVLLARARARSAARAPTKEKAAEQDGLALEALRSAFSKGYFRDAHRLRQLQSEPDLRRVRRLKGFQTLLSEAERR